MHIEMRKRDTRILGAVNLRAQFRFHLWHLRVLVNVGSVERKISACIDQTRQFDCATQWPPAQIGPFTRQCQMDAEIGVRMLLHPARHLGKPRARHEDAGRGYPSIFERLKSGAIHCMVHTKIVGMNHQQPRRCGIAQALLHCLRNRFFWRRLGEHLP